MTVDDINQREHWHLLPALNLKQTCQVVVVSCTIDEIRRKDDDFRVTQHETHKKTCWPLFQDNSTNFSTFWPQDEESLTNSDAQLQFQNHLISQEKVFSMSQVPLDHECLAASLHLILHLQHAQRN